jgi:hypothetical protein
MVETAVTISFALLCLYGGMELALIGYDQLQLDGGTFFLTHAYAGPLSAGAPNITSLDSSLAPLFPNVTLSGATFVFTKPPDTTVQPNFTQWGTTTNRYGGAAILRPQRLQASVTQTVAPTSLGANWNGLGSAGAPVTLTAGNVDARPAVSNHDDDASGEDYNSTSTYEDALVTDDQNTPPYYVAQAFMWYCTPWAKTNTQKNETTCTDKELAAVGLAEYLKSDNYNNAANGIDTNGVFALIKCHQTMFVNIANEMATLPGGPANRPVQGQWDGTNLDTYFSYMKAPRSGATGSSWDVAPIPSRAIVIPPPTDLNPAEGC